MTKLTMKDRHVPRGRRAIVALGAAVAAIMIPVGCASLETPSAEAAHQLEHPYLFHLIQADLWQAALDGDTLYYPPTYQQDGFTHATANPDLLLNVANHFYTYVPGDWLCLRMTVDSLQKTGVETVFEGTAPVGDQPANFEGTDDELFPHVLGGIHPDAVLEVHSVIRDEAGTFMSVVGVTG